MQVGHYTLIMYQCSVCQNKDNNLLIDPDVWIIRIDLSNKTFGLRIRLPVCRVDCSKYICSPLGIIYGAGSKGEHCVYLRYLKQYTLLISCLML